MEINIEDFFLGVAISMAFVGVWYKDANIVPFVAIPFLIAVFPRFIRMMNRL